MRGKRVSAGKTRRLLLGVGALTSALALAACGGDSVGGGNDSDAPTAQAGTPSGKLVISNWPGYIDQGKGNTLDEFKDATGVEVEYIEDINDNDAFFGKLQPQLDQEKSGDRSIFVVTDWMAKQMWDLGYLQKIDYGDLPNVEANLLDSLRSPAFDPDREFSVPWQTGMTGLWVDKAKAPEITSVNDLFDPRYKGKVTFLTELRDTVPLVLKADGIDPAEATNEEWQAAIDKLSDAADSGQIRRFTGNDYTEDLTSGNVVASIGWSGDAYLIENDNAEWRMPDEGCMLWSDNVVIPRGAPNTAAALAFTDFVYDPQVQADIAEFVTYVTPVQGVQEILTKRDPALGEDPLIFPTDEFTERCSTQDEPPDLDPINEAWQDVITG